MDRPAADIDTVGDVLGARIVAAIIDFVIVGFASGVISGALAAGGRGMAALAGLIAVVISFGYFIYLEGTYGQTLGKRVMGLVVVTEDGGDCEMGTSAIRNVLRIVDSLPFLYLLGIIVILVTDRDQRVGDIAAGTVVARVA